MSEIIKKTIDINQIKDLLPHRYPFLLIDRVLDYTARESLTAIKNVTVNEPFFNGHFPDAPILAGVVQLHWAVEYSKQHFLLTQIEVKNIEVLKFQVVIVPGQNLTLTLVKKAANKVLFSYASDKGQHASGRIVFEEQVFEDIAKEKPEEIL